MAQWFNKLRRVGPVLKNKTIESAFEEFSKRKSQFVEDCAKSELGFELELVDGFIYKVPLNYYGESINSDIIPTQKASAYFILGQNENYNFIILAKRKLNAQ